MEKNRTNPSIGECQGGEEGVDGGRGHPHKCSGREDEMGGSRGETGKGNNI